MASGRCPLHDTRRTTTQRGLGWQHQRNRAVVLAASGGRCYFPDCTTPATTADHIVQRQHGGDGSLGNLRPACTLHNYGRRE